MDEYAKIHGLDLHIKKGSKSSTIYKAFVKELNEDDKRNPLEKPRRIVLMVRAGAAFNAEQIEGMPYFQQKTREFTPIFAAEQLLEALKAREGLKMVESNGNAYYSPTEDFIAVPARNAFKTDEFFYDTTLHETGHWTGHQSRLNRLQTGKFGTKDYAYEEFIAEMASCMLAGEIGIPHDQRRHEHFLDYMNNWQKALQADKNLIFKASNAASRASNYQLEHLREYLYDLNMNHTASSEQNELLESIGVPERILKQIHTEESKQEFESRQEEKAQTIESIQKPERLPKVVMPQPSMARQRSSMRIRM